MADAATALVPLRVAHTAPIAEGVYLFDLRSAESANLPEFTAGAHIGVQILNGELRKYSLCNDPAERDRYVIAVQKEERGRGGSINLIENATVGAALLVSPPVNNFALSPRVSNYLFIAGGIGITPFMSMIRHLQSSGAGRFKLYYCTRSPAVTAFRDELGAPQLHGVVKIHYDQGDPARSLDLWPLLERPGGAHLYCCGPRGMMQAVRDMTGHWSRSAVHFESFIDAAATRKPEDKPFHVRLARSGDAVEVPADKTILEALRAHGHQVPSSCESGTCGTCRTKLLSGEADHRDLVLADEERDTNIMLCVSRALSPKIVIDR